MTFPVSSDHLSLVAARSTSGNWLGYDRLIPFRLNQENGFGVELAIRGFGPWFSELISPRQPAKKYGNQWSDSLDGLDNPPLGDSLGSTLESLALGSVTRRSPKGSLTPSRGEKETTCAIGVYNRGGYNFGKYIFRRETPLCRLTRAVIDAAS